MPSSPASHRFLIGALATGVLAPALVAQSPRQEAVDSILARPTVVTVVETKVEEVSSSDVVKLRNGAVFEVTSGYVGYVGYGKRAALLCGKIACQLWIDGKRLYRGDLLRAPDSSRREEGILTYIADVKGKGSILRLTNGSMYEVASYQTYQTALWFGAQQVLVVGGSRVINLDSSYSEAVEVTPFR